MQRGPKGIEMRTGARIFAVVALFSCFCICSGRTEPVPFNAKPEILSNEPGKFSCRVNYDLSSFPGKSTADARLTFWHEISGQTSPSFRVFAVGDGGSEQFIATTTGVVGSPSTQIVLTDYVNKHLSGDRKITFVIREMSGMSPEFQANTDKLVALSLEQEPGPRFDTDEALAPIWKGNNMINESLLPVSTLGAPAEGRLLFTPARDLVVRNSQLDKVYEEGRDYVVDGKVLRLTPNSSIPFMTKEQLYPAVAGPAGTTFPALNGGFVYCVEGGFREFQLAVSYRHDEAWQGPVPASGDGKLLRTKEKLRKGEPIKVVLLGDSISRGAGASWFRPPFLRSWGPLLVQHLEKKFGAPITFLNHGLGGSNSRWGILVAPTFAAAEKPDLCLIAFGMNDANKTPVKDYIENIKKIMTCVSDESPGTEFILVAPMLRNAQWRSLEPMNGYLAALKSLESEKTAVADVWSVSKHILQTKEFADISSNHVNHPNDFMVRVYAQVTAQLFEQAP